MFAKKLLCICAAVLLAGGLVSCRDYVGKEKSHPMFAKAMQAKQSGNPKEAAACLREFLDICPKSPTAHYEIACLYNDDLDDPLKALFHYERCLELAPDSADAENIRSFAENARKSIFEKLSGVYETKKTENLQAELEKTKKSLQDYIRYAGELKAQNDQMRAIINTANADRKKQAAGGTAEPSATASGTGTAPAPEPKTGTAAAAPKADTPAAAATGTSAAAGPKIYVVQPGDTLIKISQKFYGSGKYYPMIRNANRLRRDSLWVGQKLVIPPLEQGQ